MTKDDAEVQLIMAQTILHLVNAGFDRVRAARAVHMGILAELEPSADD